jgi:hypothetical protein
LITIVQIFPSRIREVGTSVGVSTQWLFNFLFSLVTPYMIAAWGSYTFLFYAALDVTMAALVFFFLKETKGKSLEEINALFENRSLADIEDARRRALERVSEDSISKFHVTGKENGPRTGGLD